MGSAHAQNETLKPSDTSVELYWDMVSSDERVIQELRVKSALKMAQLVLIQALHGGML